MRSSDTGSCCGVTFGGADVSADGTLAAEVPAAGSAARATVLLAKSATIPTATNLISIMNLPTSGALDDRARRLVRSTCSIYQPVYPCDRHASGFRTSRVTMSVMLKNL